MNPGLLNKKIKLLKTTTIYVDGFPQETILESEVWSQVNTISSKEFYESNTTNIENILKFTIRYKKDIDNSYQIVFQNKKYNIIYINNYMFKNEYLTLHAKLLEGGG